MPEEHVNQVESFSFSVSPLSHDFGALEVGQMSGPLPVNVNPVGYTSDDVLDVTANCPDFVIDAQGLPTTIYRTCEVCATSQPQIVCCFSDYINYTFNAYFTPTVGATVSCAVSVHATSGTKTVTLTGTGTLPAIALDVQPTSIAFGDVRRNTDSSQIDVVVRNNGAGTMTVSSVSLDVGFVMLAGPTSYQLGPGASMTHSLACHPTATGGLSGNFTINSDDPKFPTFSVPLSCNGIDSALDISPSPAAIATTRVGEPTSTDIALLNTGTASMNVEDVAVAGTDLTMVGAPPTGVIGPSGSVNVPVSFAATTAGSVAGTLTVTYDGGQQRISQITARALATSMSVTPDGDVNFGPVCAGQSKTQSFTVLANAEGSFLVSSLAGTTSPFSVSSPSLPFTIQGSGANKLMFDVTAMPTAAGDVTGTLALATDIPGATPRMISLSVSGIAAGVTPNPASVDFGPSTTNTTTIGQPVHLSNCSTGPITFMRARIEGTDATEFAIVSQPDTATVQPTTSATWLVVFQGHTIGTKNAAFVVDYDGGTAMVPLTGDAVGDAPPMQPDTPIDERSYYTCSSSGAGSSGFVWTFVVLGLVLWRRRRAGC